MKGNEVANEVADCVAGKANSSMLLLIFSSVCRLLSLQCKHDRKGITYVSVNPKVPLI